MKHTLTTLITMLAACAPVPTSMPPATSLPIATVLATATAQTTDTPVPTATSTPSPTPIPTIPPDKIGGLTSIPDLEQVAVAKQVAKSAIDQYAKG